ncbi:MAG: efflux RND transporter periplasmic adaptor subunit [Alphaproteobacteria bacterium]|nr:efflux RND transporter periplasmic adaptor subunit [Alphaproteobacteria bacterium]
MTILTKTWNSIKRLLLPVAIIAVASLISYALVLAKPEPEKKPPTEIARHIRAVVAHKSKITLSVITQGTVKPKQTIELVPQVSGRIVYVSKKFVAGGRFKKGELILRLDPRDYHYAITALEARLSEGRQQLIREQAEGALARSEWQKLGKGKASALTLRKPQLANVRAKLKAAKANLDVARLNLERTEIRAPFNGLLATKNVDFGQFITVGTKIGKFYSTDVLEVRLPMSSLNLSQFDIAGLRAGRVKPDVTLTGRFANQEDYWKGRIVRTEGVVDVKTRIMFVVAQLRGKQLLSVKRQQPITIGEFVSAKIAGRTYNNIFKLPREVLRQGDQVLVIDKNNQLRTRIVTVIKSDRDYVVITKGLKEGDIVDTSQLGANVDGLLVKYDLGRGAPS